MDKDRNKMHDTDANDKRMRDRNQTMTRSRTSTGEISNEEIDDDAMQRREHREHRAETTRGELGAGE